MVRAPFRARWRTVLLAAARLAGLYAVGVALLLIPVLLFPGGLSALREIPIVALPTGILFVLAFLVLAVARRVGFAVLWLLLVGLWTTVLLGHGVAIEIVIGFVGWSALALPLHALGALGVTSGFRLTMGRLSVSLSTMVSILWAGALLPAIALLYTSPFFMHPLEEAASYRVASSLARFIWAPAPFVFAVVSLAHVWLGTARSAATAPAAELPTATAERDV